MKIALVKTTDRQRFAWDSSGKWVAVGAQTQTDGDDTITLRPLSGLEVIAAQGSSDGDPAKVIGNTLRAAVLAWNGEPAPDDLIDRLPMEPLTALFEVWQEVQGGPLAGLASESAAP